MQPIAISNRFFRHELNTYCRWPKAFWRELIQNSVDAGAKKLEFTCVNKDNGHCLAALQDDGPGIDEETLRNVYFQLGETTKEGAGGDQIGGHGRARILTCFAHENYRIDTGLLTCRGEGGLFEITPTLRAKKGCYVEVEISAVGTGEMLCALQEYLGTCQLPCQATINGEPFGD